MENNTTDFQKNLKLLLRATRGESFHFIIIQHNHYGVIRNIAKAIAEKYPNRKVIRLNPRSEDYSSLTSKILQAKDGFVFVENFKVILEDSRFAIGFNQRRDKFSDAPIQLIVFLPMGPEVIREFVKNVPDLWSLRSLVLKMEQDFTYSFDTDDLILEAITEEDLRYRYSDNEIEELKARSLDLSDDEETLALKENLYVQQIDEYFNLGKYSKGFEVLQKWTDIIDENTNSKSLLNYFYWKGTLNFALGEFAVADTFLKKAFKLADELGDLQMKSSILNNRSQIRVAEGDFDRAIKNLDSSLAIKNEIGDIRGIASVLNNVSRLYNRVGQYDRAIHFLKRALKMREEINDDIGQIGTLNNLGYSLMTKFKDFEEAAFYFEKALRLSEKGGNVRLRGRILGNLSALYFQQERLKEGEQYLQDAIEIYKELKDEGGLIPAYHNLSKMYLDRQNDFIKFVFYEEKAWKLALKNKDLKGIYMIGGIFGEELCKNGNPKKGLKILKKTKSLLENTDINTTQLNDLIKKYETENP